MASPDTEVIVAVVALVISVVALSATSMQVMQQYFASALGYTECSEKVMGDWASTRTRRFSWHELRFEVEFDAPVVFVAPPDNKRGPMGPHDKVRIYVMDGLEENMKKSWTTSNINARDQFRSLSSKEQIHTADNERASWYVLLSAIQRMEETSREWQTEQYKDVGPPMEDSGVPATAPDLWNSHTLAVAVQRKRRSWDTMPRSVAKPYATSTMCHCIEIVASLGIYWKEFDRNRDRYRAEGNGFMVLGERLSDLGLCFTFSIYGKCRFEANRVIPNDEVKELCFGFVPTVYRAISDERRLQSPDDEPENLSSLKLGSRSEIAETLALIGCNNDTVRYYSMERPGVTSHLFPMSFELLGMLSRTFHIDNTCFTYLPNPTPDRWDKRSVSLVRLLLAYQQQFGRRLRKASRRNARLVKHINEHIVNILKYQDSSKPRSRLLRLKTLRSAMADCDQVLTARTILGEPQHQRREAVQDVLRTHIQEVLRLLNETNEGEPRTLLVENHAAPPSPSIKPLAIIPQRSQGPNFRDLNAASPDERQEKFMRVYFEVVRPQILRRAQKATQIRQEAATNASPSLPASQPAKRRSSGASHLIGHETVPRKTSPVPSITLHAMPHIDDAPARQSIDVLPAPLSPVISASDTATSVQSSRLDEERGPLAEQHMSYDDIWCTLVFRMVCWLMLHDFNKMDVQIPKSELMGSRMPVYIS